MDEKVCGGERRGCARGREGKGGGSSLFLKCSLCEGSNVNRGGGLSGC